MSNRVLARFNANNREDVEQFMKCYAMGRKGVLQCPVRYYLEQIEGYANMPLQSIRRIADEYSSAYRVESFKLNQPEGMYMGMYNATVNTGSLIDIISIRDKVIRDGFIRKNMNGLTIIPVKIIVRKSRFQPMFEYTNEYGAKNINANGRPMSIDFTLKIQRGDRVVGASFSIFAKGRVRFSAGSVLGENRDPMVLFDYMSETYKRLSKSNGLVVNNTTADVKLGANINLKLLYTLLDVNESNPVKFKDLPLKPTFEPTRNEFKTRRRRVSPFLYIKFGTEFTLSVSGNGTIGIQGPRLRNSLIREFMDGLKTIGILTQRGGNRTQAPGRSRSRVAKRANGMPAPNVTRRGTTCPVGKRPVPYSYQGVCPDNFYVRPNPQGQPCCYKKPVNLSYIRNKVIARYANVGVRVPNRVREIFGFGMNTNDKRNNVSRNAPSVKVAYNNTKGVMVGARQCMRFSKQSLVDIVTRLGLPLPKKITKQVLCEILKEANLNRFRIRGGRICDTYKRATLLRMAAALNVNIENRDTKDQICRKLKIKYNTIPNRLPVTTRIRNGLFRWRNRSRVRNNEDFNSLMQMARNMRNSNQS